MSSKPLEILWLEDRADTMRLAIAELRTHSWLKFTRVETPHEIMSELTTYPTKYQVILLDIMVPRVRTLVIPGLGNFDTDLGLRTGLVLYSAFVVHKKLPTIFLTSRDVSQALAAEINQWNNACVLSKLEIDRLIIILKKYHGEKQLDCSLGSGK